MLSNFLPPTIRSYCFPGSYEGGGVLYASETLICKEDLEKFNAQNRIRSSLFFHWFPRIYCSVSHNDNVELSKAMHPYLLEKRNNKYLYNIEKRLHGIRATLKVFKNRVENGGYCIYVLLMIVSY